MRIADRLLRWYSRKKYIAGKIQRINEEHHKKLKAAGSLSSQDFKKWAMNLDADLFEWREYQNEIKSNDLLREAKKMDVSLEDIPLPVGESDHYVISAGCEYLVWESYEALAKAIRLRRPAYLKERREVWEFRLKVASTILTALTGTIGAIIGLVTMERPTTESQ